jgi:hypothetical protein
LAEVTEPLPKQVELPKPIQDMTAIGWAGIKPFGLFQVVKGANSADRDSAAGRRAAEHA